MNDKNQASTRPRRLLLGAMLAAVAGGSQASTFEGDDYKVDVFYENHTVRRGADYTGHTPGLAKFRNTLQVEADKNLNDNWAFHGVFRGSWDGVYQMNSSEYGKNAGGAISLENTGGPSLPGGLPLTNAGTSINLPNVPHGGGLNNAIGTALGLPGTNAFGFNLANNPNEGLQVLGQRWHATNGGVAFGVPVRPCDYDKRGCRDFGGYGNEKLSELASPEFNNRLDFLREMYVKKTFTLDDGKDLFVKLGRQQVVWGRTDLFRVLDVINPVDYSRNNIYDELQDIRIPMFIAQAEYRMGASDWMQDRNLQVVWNVDQFRANKLGQCGSTNVMLDAGCFFRGMANLWDNGGTVANFAAGGTVATDFGAHQIGIRDVHLPNWSLANTQIGVKYEGITMNGLSFSLNALNYRSQLPSLHAFNTSPALVNPFTGAVGGSAASLIAFDVHYPRLTMIGGSMDFQVPLAGAAVRMEAAYTKGEEFANSARNELYSKNDVLRTVVGIDRPTFIPFINKNRTTLISAQLFWQHIFDHELKDGPLGKVGMVDWKDSYIGTLLIKGFMMGDRVSPTLILAKDFRAKAAVASPQVEWSVSNDLKIVIGANYKFANGNSHYSFDDCRSCNPYPPFTQYGGGQALGQSYGLAGLEPLGRFRAGPIGTAFKENDIFFTLRYKF